MSKISAEILVFLGSDEFSLLSNLVSGVPLRADLTRLIPATPLYGRLLDNFLDACFFFQLTMGETCNKDNHENSSKTQIM